jgi:hypothetical protein
VADGVSWHRVKLVIVVKLANEVSAKLTVLTEERNSG